LRRRFPQPRENAIANTSFQRLESAAANSISMGLRLASAAAPGSRLFDNSGFAAFRRSSGWPPPANRTRRDPPVRKIRRGDAALMRFE
jgi:hypothetical protein